MRTITINNLCSTLITFAHCFLLAFSNCMSLSLVTSHSKLNPWPTLNKLLSRALVTAFHYSFRLHRCFSSIVTNNPISTCASVIGYALLMKHMLTFLTTSNITFIITSMSLQDSPFDVHYAVIEISSILDRVQLLSHFRVNKAKVVTTANNVLAFSCMSNDRQWMLQEQQMSIIILKIRHTGVWPDWNYCEPLFICCG